MQAKSAINRQLQKTFKLAQQLAQSWEETSSNGQIESLCNLAEQLHCCDQVNEESTPFKEHPDLKNKLRYKLCCSIEDSIESIKILLNPLQEHTTKLSRQCQQCLDLYKKYSSDLPLDQITRRTATQPSIVDMLGYIQSVETSYRQLLATKLFLLNGLKYDDSEAIDLFKKHWSSTSKSPGLSKIPDYFMMIKYFMEEKF